FVVIHYDLLPFLMGHSLFRLYSLRLTTISFGALPFSSLFITIYYHFLWGTAFFVFIHYD
ncbi:hypothetical protein, partial [Cytobacillus pseudoceanisediminis]|uniref:hypothetical protein n=1 Tax=Cytobacillus pseudoceanisediminis TaxID=3051614 RepID=UPI003CF0BF73